MKYSRSLLARLYRDDAHGVALIEFALIFPFLMVLLFGGIEVTRLLLIQQKLEKAGYVVSDIVTRYTAATAAGAGGEISASELTTNVFPVVARLMNPYDAPEDMAAIITSLEKTATQVIVRWQIAGAGSLSGCDTQSPANCVTSIVNGLAPSAISPAVAGTPARLPGEMLSAITSYPVTSGSANNIVVSEVFFQYRPLLQTLLQGVGAAADFDFFLEPRYFVKRSFFVPRTAALLHLPPNFPVN
jgi:hypothetical protein